MTSGRYERAWDGVPWGWWLRAGPNGLEDGGGGFWPPGMARGPCSSTLLVADPIGGERSDDRS